MNGQPRTRLEGNGQEVQSHWGREGNENVLNLTTVRDGYKSMNVLKTRGVCRLSE